MGARYLLALLVVVTAVLAPKSYDRSLGSWVQLASAPAQQTTAVVPIWFKSFGGPFNAFGRQAAKVVLSDARMSATDMRRATALAERT